MPLQDHHCMIGNVTTLQLCEKDQEKKKMVIPSHTCLTFYNLTALFPKPVFFCFLGVFLFNFFFVFFLNPTKQEQKKLNQENWIISDGDLVPGTVVLLKLCWKAARPKTTVQLHHKVVIVLAFNCICLLATCFNVQIPRCSKSCVVFCPITCVSVQLYVYVCVLLTWPFWKALAWFLKRPNFSSNKSADLVCKALYTDCKHGNMQTGHLNSRLKTVLDEELLTHSLHVCH